MIGDFYNSVFLVRRAAVEGRYDKQELIPLAESDPLARLGGILNRPSYSPGREPFDPPKSERKHWRHDLLGVNQSRRGPRASRSGSRDSGESIERLLVRAPRTGVPAARCRTL